MKIKTLKNVRSPAAFYLVSFSVILASSYQLYWQYLGNDFPTIRKEQEMLDQNRLERTKNTTNQPITYNSYNSHPVRELTFNQVSIWRASVILNLFSCFLLFLLNLIQICLNKKIKKNFSNFQKSKIIDVTYSKIISISAFAAFGVSLCFYHRSCHPAKILQL